jgi:hypothetical protein
MAQVSLKTGGRYLVSANIEVERERYYLHFGYNPDLITLIKCFQGAKWHGHDEHRPRKAWSFPINRRNKFQLDYLLGNNPYKRYDAPLPDIQFEPRLVLKEDSLKSVPLYEHQKEMTKHMLAYRQVIIAAEMGLGKTLSAIECMERSSFEDWFWIGTKSSLAALRLELRHWLSKAKPQIFTYEGLVKYLKVSTQDPNWVPPHGVVFDESQRIKTPTALRSQAALHLTEAMRDTHGEEQPYVILMSGSPAPKSPLDWWHQCEVAQPGFLREGDIHKFRQRMALVINKKSEITQGVYPELITFWDSELKCRSCGQHRAHPRHHLGSVAAITAADDHGFVPSTNEVALLYRRMKGLTRVWFKKDCLDLPDKVYKQFVLEPSSSMKRAADLIKSRAPSAIMALTLLRELSDGFQYKEIPTGTTKCQICKGSGTLRIPEVTTDQDTAEYWDIDFPKDAKITEETCTVCGGSGEVPAYARHAEMVACPKQDVVVDMLEDHEDVGRLVLYAGFTGSVDRLCGVVKKQGWEYIRVDGRGWHSSFSGRRHKSEDLLDIFQNGGGQAKVAYVGHPGAGGVGVTLTASPTIVYYSNDFIAENRIQSEDRIHRIGMDVNRGATIVDIFHLSTDAYIFENIKKKRNLQDLSMGIFKKEMDEFQWEAPRRL